MSTLIFPTPRIKRKSTCSLCGAELQATEGPIIIGEEPAARTAKLVTILGQHLADKHKPEMGAIVGQSGGMLNLLVLSLFTVEDQNLQLYREQIRANIQRITRRATITPDQIAEWVSALKLPAKHVQGVADLCNNLLQILQEQGRFSPEAIAEAQRKKYEAETRQ